MLEKRALTLGYVALTDCAPLVVATELGFFAAQGLQVTLSKEPTWANIRDKLALGIVDAAQVLAGMALANSAGIGGVKTPTITALSLGLNGNAVTLSTALYRELTDNAAGAVKPETLRQIIKHRQQLGRARLRLAIVYPYSSHHYLLRYWLASGGIDPDRDVELCVLPPAQMVPYLQAGSIDGCCVGEPWNSQAVALQAGCIAVSSYQIWNNHPEKVLGVNASWAETHPETHKALIKSLLEASRWLGKTENSSELLALLSAPQYLGLPENVLAPALRGKDRGFNVFHRYAATFPWISHAEWFLTQMQRWGQLESHIDLAALAGSVYHPDIYRAAAREIGEPFPLADRKVENQHAEPWQCRESTQVLTLGADKFCDDIDYPGSGLSSYVQGFAIRKNC